jgi:hypothetical protein
MKRYGYYGMNGAYWIYDKRLNNTKHGSPQFRTKKACMIEVDRLNGEVTEIFGKPIIETTEEENLLLRFNGIL